MTVYENPSFEIGLDYRGLADLDAAIPGMPPQPLDSFGVGIGSLSADTGFSPTNNGEAQVRPGEDAMSGLDSYATDMFNDGAHQADAGGYGCDGWACWARSRGCAGE